MLELKGISKRYNTGGFEQTAMDHISVAFRDNEFVAILGPSGSGKTTMLNVIGGLDRFDSGDLLVDGISTKKFKERDWDTYRNNRIGFVFQAYNVRLKPLIRLALKHTQISVQISFLVDRCSAWLLLVRW